MPELNPIQKLAIQVQSLDPLCTGKKRKLALIKFLTENEPYFNNEDSIQYEMFKVYLKYFILPPVQITTLLLSTRFQLLLNQEQTRLQGKFVLDVYPIENYDLHFDVSCIRTMQENIKVMLNVRKKDNHGRIQDNIVNRMCDCVYSYGEVSWFEPFIEPYNISVKWFNSGYTVTSFHATMLACKAAKGVFKNEFYKTYKKE